MVGRSGVRRGGGRGECKRGNEGRNKGAKVESSAARGERRREEKGGVGQSGDAHAADKKRRRVRVRVAAR